MGFAVCEFSKTLRTEKSETMWACMKVAKASATRPNCRSAAGRARSIRALLRTDAPTSGTVPCTRATSMARIRAKWPISTSISVHLGALKIPVNREITGKFWIRHCHFRNHQAYQTVASIFVNSRTGNFRAEPGNIREPPRIRLSGRHSHSSVTFTRGIIPKRCGDTMADTSRITARLSSSDYSIPASRRLFVTRPPGETRRRDLLNCSSLFRAYDYGIEQCKLQVRQRGAE